MACCDDCDHVPCICPAKRRRPKTLGEALGDLPGGAHGFALHERSRKPLKPTREQLGTLARGYYDAIGPSAPFEVLEVEFSHDVGLLWPLIRDLVLEEAAKACEGFMDEQNKEAERNEELGRTNYVRYAECHANGAANCASIVRAMKDSKLKGKP